MINSDHELNKIIPTSASCLLDKVDQWKLSHFPFRKRFDNKSLKHRFEILLQPYRTVFSENQNGLVLTFSNNEEYFQIIHYCFKVILSQVQILKALKENTRKLSNTHIKVKRKKKERVWISSKHIICFYTHTHTGTPVSQHWSERMFSL